MARKVAAGSEETSRRDRLLTPTERRVASLVAAGMSNREVASRLGIAAKTVETHLAHVFRKLGVRSRHELAGHPLGRTVAEDEPVGPLNQEGVGAIDIEDAP